jgi:DNA-binding GntR family transcriptional regulator
VSTRAASCHASIADIDTHTRHASALTRAGARRLSASERVYQAVQARLLEGELSPGDRIAVEGLAAEFGISKQPVMEALRRLSAEGFVEIVPQVGCRVRTVDRRQAGDLFQIFAAVEGIVVALAAERRTAEQLAHLKSISESISQLRGLKDPRERASGYRALNRVFHEVMHEMAGTDVAHEISVALWDRADFYINTLSHTLAFSATLEDRHSEHEQIIAALERQDASAAREVAERHIARNLALLDDED